MKVDPREHGETSWRVHHFAREFALWDVWEFDVRGTAEPPANFDAFEDVFGQVMDSVDRGHSIAAFLFRLRLKMGRWLGWDDADPGFDVVYREERESLREVSNATVHALLHLGWVRKRGGDYAPRMAVYVKPRGLFGRVYLALINPFRHLFVYPALLRNVAAAWAARS